MNSRSQTLFAVRVAYRYLMKIAGSDLDMDIQARGRILEAAAGLQKWSLSRNPRVFLSMGPATFPDADPKWFSPRNEGVYDAVRRGALRVLRGGGGAGAGTVDEVVQHAIGLKDVFGYAGKNDAKKILNGTMLPKGVLGVLYRAGTQVAIDVKKRNTTEKKNREDGHPVLVSPGQEGSPGVGRHNRRPEDYYMDLMNNPKGQPFRDWASRVLGLNTSREQRTPMQSVMSAWFKDPAITGKQMVNAIVQDGGKSISTAMAGKHRDAALGILAKAMRSDSRMQNWVNTFLDTQLMSDRRAKKLADRYLETREVA